MRIDRRKETAAVQHAQIAIAIKVNVVVDVSDCEFLLLELLIQYLSDLLYFVGIPRIVLPDGLQELLHQDVVDLFCVHAFKSEVQMPHGRTQGGSINGRALR